MAEANNIFLLNCSFKTPHGNRRVAHRQQVGKTGQECMRKSRNQRIKNFQRQVIDRQNQKKNQNLKN